MYTLQKGRVRKTEMKPNTATPMETSYKHQRSDTGAGLWPHGQQLAQRTREMSNLKPILHKL